MQKVWVFALFALLVFGLPAVDANAAQPYVRASIGLPMPETSKMTFDGGGQFDIEYDKGLAFSLATGTSLRSFQQELELSYQQNDLDKARAPGRPGGKPQI